MAPPVMLDVPLLREHRRPSFIAHYLPQFHPTPENDAWWGPGFTEWINVVSARPHFKDHHQPHLPGELGFYDLRLSETREAQASLAADHGVDGFCYYHYWFMGRRLLARPLDDVMKTGEPRFPFCLCWANENWTRRWDGLDKEILIEQTYSADDDHSHARWLAGVFADPRYIRVDGRPLFLVYHALLLPDARRTMDILREEVTRQGLPEPFLCRVEAFPEDQADPTALGFDAAVEFQPDWKFVLPFLRFAKEGGAEPPRFLSARRRNGFDRLAYERVVEHALAKPIPAYRRFRAVTPGWDNTPRRARSPFVIDGSTPERYARWVSAVAATTVMGAVFINAWNEWGEGCNLEPCRRWGRAYLDAHRSAVEALEGRPRTEGAPENAGVLA